MCGSNLPLSAIDQDQIRHRALACRNPFVSPANRLSHGGIVVTGRDVTDIEAAVIRFFHAISVVDHAGGNGGFALGVADVETFDALYRVWKRQGCLQGRQSLFLLRGSLVFREYRQPGILQGHVRPGLVQD